jgi:activator of HSP90 ATPase
VTTHDHDNAENDFRACAPHGTEARNHIRIAEAQSDRAVCTNNFKEDFEDCEVWISSDSFALNESVRHRVIQFALNTFDTANDEQAEKHPRDVAVKKRLNLVAKFGFGANARGLVDIIFF